MASATFKIADSTISDVVLKTEGSISGMVVSISRGVASAQRCARLVSTRTDSRMTQSRLTMQVAGLVD